MAMMVVDGSSLYTGGLAAQVRWLSLRVGGRLALFNIHQMNRVNSRNDLWSWWQHYKYRPGYYYYYCYHHHHHHHHWQAIVYYYYIPRGMCVSAVTVCLKHNLSQWQQNNSKKRIWTAVRGRQWICIFPHCVEAERSGQAEMNLTAARFSSSIFVLSHHRFWFIIWPQFVK